MSADKFIDAYDGNDMASFLLKHGFQLADNRETIKSITNVRNTAIIVTDFSIYQAEPSYQIGFCIRLLQRL